MRKFQTITGQSFNVERSLKRSREESEDEDDENSQINNIDYGEKYGNSDGLEMRMKIKL